MKMSKRNKERTIRKLRYLVWCGDWYGDTITPVEGLWLLENGAIPTSSMYEREWLEHRIKHNEMRGGIFYCKVKKDSVLYHELFK